MEGMEGLVLLSVLTVIANTVWLARMNYRLFVIECRLDAPEVTEVPHHD